jgi:hypothetical protein
VSDALLWKPVPLPHLETLISVTQRIPGEPNNWNNLTPADLDDIRHGLTSLEGAAAYQEGMANIVGEGGEPERAEQALQNRREGNSGRCAFPVQMVTSHATLRERSRSAHR